MTNKKLTFLCNSNHIIFFVGILNLIIIFLMISFTESTFWKDEFYINDVKLLMTEGFTTAYLKGLIGPVGPLYSLMHFVFSPVTQLTVKGIRYINFLWFIIILFVHYRIILSLNKESLFVTCLLIAFPPFMYGIIGTAITEIPTYLFFIGHLYFLIRAIKSSDADDPKLFNFIIAGLFFGVAASGRQTLLAFLGSSIYLFYNYKHLRKSIISYVLMTLIIPCSLFFVWKGLVPPKMAIASGFNIFFGFLAFSYAGFVYAIYSPGYLYKNLKVSLAVLIFSLITIFLLDYPHQIPLLGIANTILPKGLIPIYTKLAHGSLLTIGFLFIYHCYNNYFKTGLSTSINKFLMSGIFFLLIAQVKVTLQFSGRYIASTVFIMLIVLSRDIKLTKWLVIRLIVCATAGFFSLERFYNYMR